MNLEVDESPSRFRAVVVDCEGAEDGTRATAASDAGFRSLEAMLGGPMEVGSFLRIAIAIGSTLGGVHQRRRVHKDIKPANILVNPDSGEVRLTGFGLASHLPRERRAPEPPEFIAGTLAYMSPEQSGRMNRSIDSRSDLYALGVTLYEMLTGSLPFTATDPMELLHCHIARRPVPPAERTMDIPVALSAIVMKLLEKQAEERYQTAAGVEKDLRRCLVQWEADRWIDPFPPGLEDTPDRLMIPEKLYGRDREIETLLASFDRIVKGGAPELVLVTGYSGIGKSSVVNELHKVLVPTRGLFATGKFDQCKRDVPYATLAQALQGIVRGLLAKSEAGLGPWRDAIGEALGPSGRLMTDLIPELAFIVGNPPPVAELEPQQSQARFQLVFRRFIGVFARPEHPLVLFLDDLQWLDAATLDLLEDLLTRADLRHLLLIGAYRDNEVSAVHPLTRKIDAIKTAGGQVAELNIPSLAKETLGQFMADALRREMAAIAPLVQLVHEKTGGNPFFVIQFISALAEDEMLTFDHGEVRWSWDIERIHAKGYTDNVVDLMVCKLARLPIATQKALQQLACIGGSAETSLLAIALETAEEQVHAQLWEAVRLELVECQRGSYKFAHDRIQEAAYSLIPQSMRAAAHLRIGRSLVSHTPPDQRTEAIFDIVNQLNRGAALIGTAEEREQLADLNLLAVRRAKASTAYSTAIIYLDASEAMSVDNPWKRRRDHTFELELNRAECEFLTGELPAADARLTALSERAATTAERARIACLHMDVCTTIGQMDRSVEVFLDYSRHVGIEWSPHPTKDEARFEYERMWTVLGSRAIEELIDLPLMTDEDSLATVDVLTKAGPPSLFTDQNLHSMVLCRATSLSIQHGNTDGSCVHYVGLSETAGPNYGDYEAGYRFGVLGYQLVEKRGLRRFQPATYMVFGGIAMPWAKHVRDGRDLLRRAFEVANRIGDLTYAAYSTHFVVTNLLAAGDTLEDAQREAENGLAFAKKARFGFVVDIITAQLMLIRTLRGSTPTFGRFDDPGFEEGRFEDHLASHPALALPACWYWVRKLQARCLSGDHAAAIEASRKAEELLWTSPSVLEAAEYHFYAAVSRGACCDRASLPERQKHLDCMVMHHRQLLVWAGCCPQNFENRAALVGAEIARIEGRELEAQQLYEQAVRSAHEHGFVQNEGLAYELAARFYAARGFDDFAHLYLQRARTCYAKWGADGKARQLDERYPNLRQSESAPDARAVIVTPIAHLDIATVLKVSQAISGEIVLERLVETVLRSAIEYAGAERGQLLLAQGSELLVRAEGETCDHSVAVRLCERAISATELPESVVRYAVRTREAAVLADASAQDPYATDEYIRAKGVRSVLCLPLVKQGSLVALLYLENRLASSVFTPSRIALLEVLASQAAISLENSGLYRKLQQRDAEVRRLVDADIVGIVFWDRDGGIRDANDAFLRLLGYERAELVAGRLRWTDLTPAEWLKRDREIAEMQVRLTGRVPPYEKEFFHKDGSRVPVLIGAAAFDEDINHGVAFVVDIAARKRAEEDLRRSQHYLAEAQRLSHIGSWAFNATGFGYWSPGLFKIHGLDPGSKVPSIPKYLALVHPEDRDFILLEMEKLLSGAEGIDFTKRIVRPDGTIRHLRYVGSRATSDGVDPEFVGTAMDVTEPVRAQEELRASERKYRNLVDTTPVLINTTLANGDLDFINLGWLEYLGVSTTDMIGWQWTSVHHPDDVEDTVKKFRAAIASGQAFENEARVRGSDGKYRWFLQLGRPLRDETGAIVKWYCSSIDIEERKNAEKATRRSEAYLAEAQRVSHTGSWAWSPAANANLHWSEECYRLLGFDPTQGTPSFETAFERIHPDDRSEVRETLERAVSEKADFQIDYRLALPDGTRRNVLSLAHPVLDAAGNLVEFVGTIMDITVQKCSEEERKEHLWFLESMDRINRAMQRSDGPDVMIGGVLEEALSIFGCDRVRLLYPCDPDSPTVRAVMEQTRPGYPSPLVLGEEFPLDAAGSTLLRSVLLAPGAVENPIIPPGIRERLSIRSVIAIAIRPKRDRPYLLGLHQCSHARTWTTAERRLFEEIARRLEDALTSVLAYRNLVAREKELRRSQHYLAASQTLTRTGSWSWNPFSNDILYWSDECYRILDYDPALGIPSFESVVGRIHPEDRAAVLDAAEKAVAEKAILRLDYRVILPSGVVRNHRLLTDPVLNASGELIEYLGTVMDVTEQSSAEEERREHVWFLESMDRINRAIQRTNDVEGMMQGVLEETLATLGPDRAWLIYPCDPDTECFRVVMEQTRPEYPTTFSLDDEFPMSAQRAENLRRVLAGPGAVTDVFVPQESRERFDVQSVLAIAVRPKGDRPYLLALHQCSHARVWNAAERRLSEEIARRLEDALTSVLAHRNLVAREEELRRSRAYLAEAEIVSHTGSWVWNNVTKENVYWSEECFRIHGCDPAQGRPTLEQTIADIHPDDVPAIVASLEPALREGRAWEGEYRLTNFADGPRTIRSVAHPIPGPSGEVVEYIGIVADITRQKQAEQVLRTSELERARAEQALRDAREKLAQASKIASLAELSASIAHEINQPLQAIVSNGQASLRWLDAAPPNIEKAIRTAERVVRDGNAAAEVVGRIRALFKYAAPAKNDLDINKLIAQVSTLMADEIQGNGVSVETELGEDVPMIRADAVQIQQVIVNLVRNAIEAMAGTSRKPLLIRSMRSATHVVVEVSDQGAGVADPEKIFEPFVTTKQTGMGMGLAICRSIIEAHAGDIRVAHNDGPGTTLRFSLPIDASDAT